MGRGVRRGENLVEWTRSESGNRVGIVLWERWKRWKKTLTTSTLCVRSCPASHQERTGGGRTPIDSQVNMYCRPPDRRPFGPRSFTLGRESVREE